MNETSILVTRLRERAALCRRMADGAVSSSIASELCSIAREYEQDAAKVETAAHRFEDQIGGRPGIDEQ